MPPHIQNPNNIRNTYSSNGSVSTNSLEQVRQEFINTYKKNESLNSWFEKKITPDSSLPDWNNLSRADLDRLSQMSPEDQQKFFKLMPPDGPKILAKLMTEDGPDGKMPIEEQAELMCNMTVEQQVRVLAQMDPQDGEKLFNALPPKVQNDISEYNLSQTALRTTKQQDADTLEFLQEVVEKAYGTKF